jgi:SecD/SecF fusion protein
MSMNSEGAKIWSRMTRDNIGKQIAIVLDNYVYSFPVVNDKIESGNSSISGDFSNEEADDLVSILNAGSCPVKLKVIAVDIKEAPKK